MLETLIQLHQSLLDINRVPYILGAIAFTFICGLISGPLAGNANPAVWAFYNVFIGRLGDRMDKSSRPQADLVFRGFLATVFCIMFSYFCGNILLGLTVKFSWIEFFVLCACMTGGSVWYMLLSLYFSLEKKYTHKGLYYALSRSTRTDLNSVDEYGIVRESIAYLGNSFDKGVVAPSFWYLVGGIPVLLIYSTVAALSWRFGKCGFTKGFGSIPNELEKLMGFAPSLFTGFLITAAITITPTSHKIDVFKQWFKRIGKASYFEGGFVVSALSWGLNITLGGAVQDITGSSLQKHWVGSEKSTAKLDHGHIRRALYTILIANLLFILALSGVYVLKGKGLI